MTTYSWKIDKYPVAAKDAAAEFGRIYAKYGEITTKNVVDESRGDGAVLHACFEWNDAVAAEKYRLKQAGDMIRCLVTTEKPDDDSSPVIVRAIVKTTERFEPISVTVKSEEKYAILIADAISDMQWFRRKYETLKELVPVFRAMQDFEKTMEEQ